MPGFESNRFIDLSEREAKLLKCSICLNILNNPIQSLVCDHTFCKDCVFTCIRSNQKLCPECRKEFSTRKRNSRTDQNWVIVLNHIFRRNLMANNFINDLKTKCDYESKGCKEVIEFGLLSSHLKQCEHRLCKTCGFDYNGDQHNCVQLLKDERIELKDRITTLEAIVSNYEENKLLTDNKMRETEEKISDLEEEVRLSKRQINQLQQKVTKSERQVSESEGYGVISKLLMTATQNILPLVLKPDYVFFSTYKATVLRIELKSATIEVSGILAEKYPLIDKIIPNGPQRQRDDFEFHIKGIEELMCCLDTELPVIVIKMEINYRLRGDKELDKYMVIVLKNMSKHFITGFVNYCKRKEPKINCKELNINLTKKIIKSLGFETKIQ